MSELVLNRPEDLGPEETYCGDCGAIWNRTTRLCHCASCHSTYIGITDFDGHQTAPDRAHVVCTETGRELHPSPSGRFHGHKPPGQADAVASPEPDPGAGELDA